jgi:hypothetical protein
MDYLRENLNGKEKIGFRRFSPRFFLKIRFTLIWAAQEKNIANALTK